MLIDPLRYVHLSRYRAILFRRTFPELEKSLIQRSFQYYQPAFPGARYNEQKHVWCFPSGALIYFSHLEHDKSVYAHQSAEYQYCVERGTPIRLADGSLVAVESISAGDLVATLDGPRRVSRTHGPKLKRCYVVTTERAAVVVGEDHRFLTENGWVTVSSSGDGRNDCAGSGDARQAASQPQALSARLVLYGPAPLPGGPAAACSTHPDAQAHVRVASSAPGSPADCRGGRGSDGGPPRPPEADDPAHTPSPAGAVEPVQQGWPPDDLGSTRRRSRSDGFEYRHPYTLERRVSCTDVHLAQAHIAPAGAREVFDLTVEGASHYVSLGGFISSNCGFDELTSFTHWQYTYMLSRARSSSGIPIRVRGGTNPGGEGHDWVQRRWAPWLGPPADDADDYRGPRALPGQVLNYLNEEEGEAWVPRGTPKALSRVFIPAKLADNPHIDAGYEHRLMGLDKVTRARLKDGNWLIKPAKGLYFRRDWFKFVDVVPAAARRLRYWDLAATEAGDGADPDWTVGLLLAIHEGQVFIENVIRFRGTPSQVEATILATAEVDGPPVHIGLPQDPGQAGKFQASVFIRKLQGYVAHAMPETGDKVTRAGPISAQAEAGNVSILRGRWNAQLINELEAFPEGSHDDVVDALSGAYSRVAGAPAPTFDGQSPIVGKWGAGRGR